ncbi:MAG: ATP-binding protein [Oscillospiraceae bacterium]|jgi:anti-sigma regulatory factor (Ser/Thr protein kinase)|nr:ATP-binding protein [Oscillospiraceae bacterium]
MRDISLHVLDLAQNSVAAQASRVEISLAVDRPRDSLTLVIADDGRGMTKDFAQKALSPFATTRTTRKVGLGLPMMLERARAAGGGLTIESEPGKGAKVTVKMRLSHVDRPPLGDLDGTLLTLVLMAGDGLDYLIRLEGLGEPFELDTALVREALGGVPLSDPEASMWLKEALAEAAAPYKDADAIGAADLIREDYYENTSGTASHS